MLTINDLMNLCPVERVATVTLGGVAFPVRGLTAAELAEIDAIITEPIPPLTAKDRPDTRDPTYLHACDVAEQRRNAVAVAVAIDFGIDTADAADGPLTWDRSGLGGTPKPRSMRAAGPELSRKRYAEAVADPLLTSLGLGVINRLLIASRRLGAGEAPEAVAMDLSQHPPKAPPATPAGPAEPAGPANPASPANPAGADETHHFS